MCRVGDLYTVARALHATACYGGLDETEAVPLAAVIFQEVLNKVLSSDVAS